MHWLHALVLMVLVLTAVFFSTAIFLCIKDHCLLIIALIFVKIKMEYWLWGSLFYLVTSSEHKLCSSIHTDKLLS